MREVLVKTICLGAAVAVACGGTAHTAPGRTASAIVAPPSADATTAVASIPAEFPVAPAYHDQPVWDFVRQWQGADISPILRPAFLPSGFDTVTVPGLASRSDPYHLSVEYTGPGKMLHIEAGGINPSEAYQDGSQHPATVRGHAAVLEVNRGGDPRNGVALWWTEPGKWTSDVGPTVYDHVDYALIVVGLTQEEVLEAAESLAPVGP